MISHEHAQLQRIFLLLSLGITDALRKGIISHNEAEWLLFSPRTMSYCKSMGTDAELVHLIHMGTELESIRKIVSVDDWLEAIDKIRSTAFLVLSRTEPCDTQLDPWIEKLLPEFKK